MLRAALFVLGGLLLLGAASLLIVGCALRVVLPFAVPGLLLLFALVVEQWRYKPVTARRPGPDWIPTDERFVDPGSGKLVNERATLCDRLSSRTTISRSHQRLL
jgi:hypothetical protein